jgi:hypothetical protein
MVTRLSLATIGVALTAAALGMCGLSERVVGQDAAGDITSMDPFGPAETAAERDAVAVTRREEQAAGVTQPDGDRPWREGARRRLSKAEAILAKLDEIEVQLSFQEAPLSTVLDYFQEATGIPVVIDRSALDDVGMGPDAPVTVDLSGVTAGSGLKLMLKDFVVLDYAVRDEVLLITNVDVAQQVLDPRVYLLDGIEVEPDQLIEWIPAMIAPDTWEETGGTGKIRSFDRRGSGVLIAQTCQVHAQIAEFLEKLRRSASEDD